METIKEILSEMRGDKPNKNGKRILSNIATDFADRIEAAYKREIGNVE